VQVDELLLFENSQGRKKQLWEKFKYSKGS
jgi:hypothetical protein